MSENLYTCSLTFRDNYGNPIILSKFRTVEVKYYYFKDSVWVSSVDYNVDKRLNLIWVRVPEESYNNKFLINICVGPEQVYHSGVQDVVWNSLPNPEVYELTVIPVLSDNAEGFAPRVIDGFWYEYSEDFGGLYNTGIQASATVIEGNVVDFAERGNLNAITSNAVWNLNHQTELKFNEVSINIQRLSTDLIDTNNEVSALKRKNYSVTVNGVTTPADQNGNMDLGTISGTDDLKTENFGYVETITEINNVTAPRGSGYIEKDGERSLISLSSPNYFYNVPLSLDGWMYVASIGTSCVLNITYTQYNNKYSGIIYIEKNGYSWSATTTSPFLSDRIFLYVEGINCYLIAEGNSHINCGIAFDSNIYVSKMGALIRNYQDFKRIRIKNFLTSGDADADYVTITESPYEIYPEDLVKTNFIVEPGNLLFKLRGPLDFPVSLKFSVLGDTEITIQDSLEGDETSYNFTSSSGTIPGKSIANFVFTNSGDFSWDLTQDIGYEITSNKVSEITETSDYIQYPSAKAVFDYVESKVGGQGGNYSIPGSKKNNLNDTYFCDINSSSGTCKRSVFQTSRAITNGPVTNATLGDIVYSVVMTTGTYAEMYYEVAGGKTYYRKYEGEGGWRPWVEVSGGGAPDDYIKSVKYTTNYQAHSFTASYGSVDRTVLNSVVGGTSTEVNSDSAHIFVTSKNDKDLEAVEEWKNNTASVPTISLMKGYVEKYVSGFIPSGTVKSVNGIAPDIAGNVEVPIPDTSEFLKTDYEIQVQQDLGKNKVSLGTLSNTEDPVAAKSYVDNATLGQVKSVSVNSGDPVYSDLSGNVDLEIETYTMEIVGGGEGDSKMKFLEFTTYQYQLITLRTAGKYAVLTSFGGSSIVDLRAITEVGSIVEFDNLNGNSFLIMYSNSAEFDIGPNTYIKCILTPTGWRIGVSSSIEWN